MTLIQQGIKNAEIPQKPEEKEETVSVTLCNESCNNVNPDRGSSTPNLVSATEIPASDKEKLVKGSKEEIPQGDEKKETVPTGPETSQNESNVFDEKDLRDRKGTKEKRPGPPSVSCVIQFNTMWYNFAAPPQTPITRKIDYTR